MQFREQGRKIQCIRSAYDSTRKRSFQKVICTFDRWMGTIPSEGLEALTDLERNDLDVWFRTRQSAKLERVQHYRVNTAGNRLADIAAAILAVGVESDRMGDDLWRGLAEVRRALRKSGVRAPIKRKPMPASGK